MSSKSGYEAKVERATWFGMMIAFLGMTYTGASGTWTCIVLSIITLVSGIYQYRRGFTVGPAVWGVGFVGLALGGYGLYFQPAFDLSLLALVMVIVVIAMGVVTKQS